MGASRRRRISKALNERPALNWFGRRRLGLVAAEIADHAAPAFGLARLADVAAVQDEQMMGGAAPRLRGLAIEDRLDLLDILAGREAGAVGDAKDMGVDREGLGAEGDVHHHIGRLAP